MLVSRGRVGRPRAVVNRDQVGGLRAAGASWRAIARELGLGEGTVRRAYTSSVLNARLPQSGKMAECC